MRPIPSGRISARAAFNYSLAIFAAGCIFAGLVNQICLAVAAFNSALLFLYARNLKATPLAGNTCVAFLTGSTFLFGGAAAGTAGLFANRIPFLLSFLVSMSREIAKDISVLPALSAQDRPRGRDGIAKGAKKGNGSGAGGVYGGGDAADEFHLGLMIIRASQA